MNSTAMTTETGTVERLHVDHETTKRLGHWTAANRFEVRARSGAVVLDLRSPAIEDDVEIRLDLHRSMVKLLLPEEAQVDHWNLGWTGKGRIKDDQRPAPAGGRQVRLAGRANDSEIRVHRGGIAILSAMFSRVFVADLRQARKNGTYPTVDDPTRTIR
ncbi:MAG TPA: hypothetical protein VMA97_06880 [Streptosporangiaceae bacterium]|nr:hypothetical protein [Streptosporangiaceae bacterium]